MLLAVTEVSASWDFFFPFLEPGDSPPGMPVEISKSGSQEASVGGPLGSCGWEWNTFTSNLVKRMYPSFTLVIKATWYSFMLIYSESCQLMVMFSQLLSQLWNNYKGLTWILSPSFSFCAVVGSLKFKVRLANSWNNLPFINPPALVRKWNMSFRRCSLSLY